MKLDLGSLWRRKGDSPKTAEQPNHGTTNQPEAESRGGLFNRFRKEREEGERRRERRKPAGGAVLAYWIENGEAVRARGELVDSGVNGAGLGAVIRKQPPVDSPAWVLTTDGQALGALTRHAGPTEDGLFRIGVDLNLGIRESQGWGAVRVRWIDEEGQMRVSAASLRNATEGLVEASCVEKLPEGILAYVDGHEVGCLTIVRTAETYGQRCLVKLETLTDVIENRADAA